ncbi:hypothetical protein [Pseudomonas sp. R5(2019)]|uniref:hypothetical protein n=1 Tax=Pseudomonas sp. R5(2019) TaxID=2697566 RepID=UPI001413576F|nr:hypothetical protein [Pseudomonas sp. R5(2019)]NBA94864.1 hypothetical protein [Pseudomonas sp. R5(2019)]
MKKIVPDPPRKVLAKTIKTPIDNCNAGHLPLLAVQPGIHAEDALIHTVLYLQNGIDSLNKVIEQAPGPFKGLALNSLHSMEMAKGVVEAVLGGMKRGDPGTRM